MSLEKLLKYLSLVRQVAASILIIPTSPFIKMVLGLVGMNLGIMCPVKLEEAFTIVEGRKYY